MIKSLLSVRFRALFAGLTAQGRQKKKSSPGMVVLLCVLYLYLAAVICGVMGMTFYTLAYPYHASGLDWLYFAMAGLMSLGFAVIGSVFTTQSQLYDAKDNAMLLAMPIPPKYILLSRMIPLLCMNLLFAGIVMVPAMVVYSIFVSFSVWNLVLQLLALLAVTVLAQAIVCLLGWGLHLLLSKMNKSIASLLYMVVFLGIYFTVYSQASQLLQSLAVSGSQIAAALRTWVWPIYAMGQGCMGGFFYLLVFIAIAAALFALVYWVLSATFLRTATMPQAGSRRRKLDTAQSKGRSATEALISKELRKFLGCPVYLTNMGLGVILTLALPVAGLIFRDEILEVLTLLPELEPLIPLFICAVLAFTTSTVCISTPSVSLEGKNLWILKAMPLSSREILNAKLRFHCRLSVPAGMIAGFALGLTFGCGIIDSLLAALIPGLLNLVCGLVGMLTGLRWAKLDYISEAYPCKQSVSVIITMLVMMGIPLALGLFYGLCLLWLIVSLCPTVFMVLCCLLLAGLSAILYRVLMTWGTRKWEALA